MRRQSMRILAVSLCAALFAVAAVPSYSAMNQESATYVPKELYLIRDNDSVIVANIPFNRFDQLKLRNDESVRNTAQSHAVAVVVTTERILGYGSRTPTWRPLQLYKQESIQKLEVQDYGALVITSKRFLNFNGNNGAWAERAR